MPNNSIYTFYKNVLANQIRHSGLLLLLLLALGISVAYECLIPLIFKWLFNEVLPHKNMRQVLDATGMLAIGFISVVFAITAQILCATKLGVYFVNYLRFKVFRKIQVIQLEGKDEAYESSIVARFSNDIAFVENVTIFTFWQALRYLILCVIGTGLLIYFDWRLTILAAILIPLSLLVPRFFSRTTNAVAEEKKQIENNLLATVQEGITLQAIVRLFLLKKYKRRLFKENLHAIENISYRYNMSKGFTTRTTFLGMNLTRTVILCFGAYLVVKGHLGAGQLIGFIILLDNVSYALTGFSSAYPLLNQGASSLNNILELLAEKIPSLHTDSQIVPPLNNSIQVKNASLRYGDKLALANANLIIQAGQSIAFVGTSGAGKSTFLKLLLQEQQPSSGTILFDNIEIQKIASRSLLEQIGVVTQQAQLFDLSIKDNIRMGKLNATDEEIITAAQQAEIHNDIMSFPQQYDTLIGKRNAGLSGGQAQRIAIARALISKPTIICLDEATSALDPITGAAVDETMAKTAGRQTLITITHRLSSVVNADQIFVLDKGQIVESGTHQQLLSNNNLYKKLWDKQQGFTFNPDATQAYVAPQWLKQIPLFESLDNHSLNHFANEFVLERFEDKQIIVNQGEPGEKFYILAAGQVDVVVTNKEGKETIINKLIDGDFFGEIALLFDTPRTATIKTTGVCMLLTLHRQQFHKIFQQLPINVQTLLLNKAKERLAQHTLQL